MARTVEVKLGGQAFVIKALNVEQLERLSELQGTAQKQTFGILKLALERAEPTPDYATLDPTFQEIKAVIDAVMKLSGADDSGNAAAPGGAPS